MKSYCINRSSRLAFLVGVMSMYSTLPMAPATAQDRPAIVEKDPDDGSPVFNIYDMVALKDGKLLFANPNWSKNRTRPVALQDIRELIYIPYNRQKGGRAIDVKDILAIKHWERTYSEAAVRAMDQNNFRVADLLVKKIEERSKDWPSVPNLRARIEAKRSELKINKPGREKEGLDELERLATRYPGSPHVEETFVRVLIRLATEALGAEDADMSGDYLDRATDSYPNNRLLNETRRKWQSEAEELIVIAERAQKTDSGTAIAKAQRTVRLTADTELRRRARIVIRNAEGLLLACYEDAGAFEPINATRPVERQIVRLMHDFLMERDETGTSYGKSGLVDDIQRKSLGREYQVRLHPGYKFSDGSPITAADVVASVELLKRPEGEAYDAEWARFVAGAKQISPYEVRISVNPYPKPDSLLFFPILSGQAFTQLPKRGSKESRSPTVSGPFRLSFVYPNRDVELLANGKFRSPPQIGKITFKHFVQRGTGQAVTDLLEGRIHTISDPSPEQLERIRNVPAQFATKRIETNSVWILAINHRSSLFNDTRNTSPGGARELRLAVAQAIDRQGILDQYFNLGGTGIRGNSVVTGPFPRQSPAYDKKVPKRDADPATARSTIERQAAVLRSRTLVLKYAEQGSVVGRAMDQIKRDLEAVGFQIDLQSRPSNAFARELAMGSYDLAYYRIEHDNVLFNIANLFDSSAEAIKSGKNFMGYRNQALSQLFEELRLAKEAGQIWTIQNQIHKYLNTEAVIVPLWQLDAYFAHTRRLVGRDPNGVEGSLPIDPAFVFRNVDQWYLKPIQ